MTKTQATDFGKERGIAFADRFSDEWLRADVQLAYDEIKRQAQSAALDAGCRTVDSGSAATFIHAFDVAATGRYTERRMELPDVKAAQQLKWMLRHVESTLEANRAELAKFSERFEKDAEHAFEWSGNDAAKAAAYVNVYGHLLAVVEAENGGLVKAVEAARNEALRYARYGNHSTSPMANLMAEFKAAAFAEFAEHYVRW